MPIRTCTNCHNQHDTNTRYCPSCAALFDAEEKRAITYTIPARAAAIVGHIYC